MVEMKPFKAFQWKLLENVTIECFQSNSILKDIYVILLEKKTVYIANIISFTRHEGNEQPH